jgi:hypothetical protein
MFADVQEIDESHPLFPTAMTQLGVAVKEAEGTGAAAVTVISMVLVSETLLAFVTVYSM